MACGVGTRKGCTVGSQGQMRCLGRTAADQCQDRACSESSGVLSEHSHGLGDVWECTNLCHMFSHPIRKLQPSMPETPPPPPKSREEEAGISVESEK